MTGLVSVIGLLALLSALVGTVLLDLAREAGPDGPGAGGRRLLGGVVADRRAVGFLVGGSVLLGAVCTVLRLVGSA